MWPERKRFGIASMMAPRPPPPRAAMLYLYIFNMLLFVSATTILAAGVGSFLVPGGAAVRTSLAEIQGSLPVDNASRLLEALEYAPQALSVIGALLAAIACAGCCSSFSSGRCVLYVYVISLGLLVCAETAVAVYGIANSAGIESTGMHAKRAHRKSPLTLKRDPLTYTDHSVAGNICSLGQAVCVHGS